MLKQDRIIAIDIKYFELNLYFKLNLFFKLNHWKWRDQISTDEQN